MDSLETAQQAIYTICSPSGLCVVSKCWSGSVELTDDAEGVDEAGDAEVRQGQVPDEDVPDRHQGLQQRSGLSPEMTSRTTVQCNLCDPKAHFHYIIHVSHSVYTLLETRVNDWRSSH